MESVAEAWNCRQSKLTLLQFDPLEALLEPWTPESFRLAIPVTAAAQEKS
jgi:hypothetical protein